MPPSSGSALLLMLDAAETFVLLAVLVALPDPVRLPYQAIGLAVPKPEEFEPMLVELAPADS